MKNTRKPGHETSRANLSAGAAGIQTRQAVVSLVASLFAPILAVLLLTGCPNPVRTPEADDGGQGILSLAIGRQITGRAIMPSANQDFVLFRLNFVPADECDAEGNEALETIEWTEEADTVKLNAGIWNLFVTAFLAGENGEARAAAAGELLGIEVPAGHTVSGTVPLAPIPGGLGTFVWEITLPSYVQSAEMTITRIDANGGDNVGDNAGDNVEVCGDSCELYAGGTGYVTVNLAEYLACSLKLCAGQYRVQITVYLEPGERAAVNAILRIYRYMESVFEYGFTDGHFALVPLLDHVLSAWNADEGEWDFADAEITAAHFYAIGVMGIEDDAHLSEMENLFNKLSTAGATYDLPQLKTLVDVALVYAALPLPHIDIALHRHQTAVGNVLEALVTSAAANGSEIDNLEWAIGGRTATLNIGGYGIPIALDYNMPVLVSAMLAEDAPTLANQLAWLRQAAATGGAQSGNFYLVELSGEYQTINPSGATGSGLPTGRTDVTVTLRGTEREPGDDPSEIRLGANGVLFTVVSGLTLVLDENVTLVGRSEGGNGNANNNNPVVRVDDGGTLVMNPGVAIRGNTNGSPAPTNFGSGVRVNGGGNFVMNGGAIFDNASTNGGGGVNLVGADANLVMFTMHGGAISDNTAAASSSGGGVQVNGGTFVMYDGEISGNTATSSSSGGGVLLGSTAYSATFIMHGGTISDNTADGSGSSGGVRIFRGTFDMYDGEISDNTTTGTSGAGGVVLGGISGNLATFTMHGGTVSDNAATNTTNNTQTAGGVRVGALGNTFNMRGGTISGNDSRANVISASGGVTVDGGSFRISDGTIHGTNADPPALANTMAAGQAALFWHIGATALRGTFDADGEFVQAGDPLGNFNLTLRVENGELMP